MLGSELIKTSPHNKYWSINENWRDIDKVSEFLFYVLTPYREKLNKRLFISSDPDAVYAIGGHSKKSWHKIVKGRNDYAMAIDLFPECDIAYAWITALRFPFGGIGVYPFAKYPSKRIKGMLHLDVRPYDEFNERALWYVDYEGEYKWLRNEDDVIELLGILSR